MNTNILSTSTLASPAIVGGAFGPVAQEGYGIGYGMDEENLRFNVTGFHPVTPFIEKLNESLKEMITGNVVLFCFSRHHLTLFFFSFFSFSFSTFSSPHLRSSPVVLKALDDYHPLVSSFRLFCNKNEQEHTRNRFSFIAQIPTTFLSPHIRSPYSEGPQVGSRILIKPTLVS